MKKINVYRDIESQKRNMESSVTQVVNVSGELQTGIDHAESEVIPESANDQTVPQPEEKKKRGRSTSRDI